MSQEATLAYGSTMDDPRPTETLEAELRSDPSVEGVEKALALAKMGLAVFPCLEVDEINTETGETHKRQKAPYSKNGFRDATTDPFVIRSWWRRWPKALVGVPTGKGNGIVVLDLDQRSEGTGAIAFVKNGRRVYYPRNHVLEFLRTQTFISTAEAKKAASNRKNTQGAASKR